MNNDVFFQIHNKFELKLYGKDGKIKQTAYGFNKANSEKYVATGIGGLSGGSYGTSFTYITLGTGNPSGFTPSENDYKLNSYAFRQNVTFTRISPFQKEYNTIEYQSNDVTFPATTSYKGNLTEIGIGSNDYNAGGYSSTEMRQYLYSHAYLVDAEGNPITIEKTEYDILIVKAVVYITPILKDIDSSFNFKFFPAYSSSLGGSNSYGNAVSLFTSIFPSANGGRTYYFSPQYVPESDDGKIYNNAMPDIERSAFSTSQSNGGSLSYNSSAGTQDFSQCFPITFSSLNNLSTQAYNNFGFAHSIIIPSLGAISLPNKNIIPEYTIKDVAIGTGDGETTHFYTSINELALDEQGKPKLVVYIQNSETEGKSIVDSSEYEFINFSTKKSPLWNKAISVEDYNLKTIHNINSFKMTGTKCRCGVCALTNCSFPVEDGNYNNDWYYNNAIYYAPNYRYRVIYYDEKGITLDEAKIGNIQYEYPTGYMGYSSGYSNLLLGLTLSYRNSEEEDWTDISVPSSNMSTFVVTKFEAVTAKYWKLQTSDYGSLHSMRGTITYQGSNRLGSLSGQEAKNNNVYGYDPNYIMVGNSAEYDFAKVGLNFKTAPPEGAIITMDATLDLPYKTPDGSMTFSYQSVLNSPVST